MGNEADANEGPETSSEVSGEGTVVPGGTGGQAADPADDPSADSDRQPARRLRVRKRARSSVVTGADPEDLDSEDVDEDSLSERLTQQLAHQWALLRAERRTEPTPIESGPSNFSRAQVPWALDLAAAWSWRVIVISVATLGLLWLASYFAVITLPLVIALLIAALAAPMVRGLKRIGIPQALSALVVVIVGIGAVGALLTFVGREIITGGTELAGSVVDGLEKIRTWLRDGPLNASDSQINNWIQQAQETITERTQDGEVVTHITEFGAALGHVLAGFFIVLFATYFFLADGERIWAWMVRMFPRAARERVDSSGRVAWHSLTQFVRATVMVAMVDAIGIMIAAKILGLPLVLPIGVLVFLGAFIPMVGATVAGAVAVLVALVDQGPWTALFMLGAVILVQQIEGHVLQPFLMGRFVSLHPLGVIVAIGCGVLVAGIAGALVAVPLAAVVNAVAQHLAAHTEVGEGPLVAAEDDPGGGAPAEKEMADKHDHE